MSYPFLKIRSPLVVFPDYDLYPSFPVSSLCSNGLKKEKIYNVHVYILFKNLFPLLYCSH